MLSIAGAPGDSGAPGLSMAISRHEVETNAPARSNRTAKGIVRRQEAA
ncbi:MAG: hypothetical protein O3B74_04635 [Proteobacteria bacterium]|nr:hypothetical protein [Pseudomonadota bacterium]